MRVLYLSQYFPPEMGATQSRAFEMARGLVRAGHQVTMLCEVPNHPAGIIWPAYRRRLWLRCDVDGIDVVYLWVITSPRRTFSRRMAFYLSFMINAVLAGLFLARGRYDVVYATSPPLFVGAAGMVLAALRRLPLVFEVRDLWPESAVQLGELSSKWVVRLATRLEEACYRRACRTVVVTQGIYDSLAGRGHPPARLALIPNGANTELYTPQPPDPQLRRRLNIPESAFVAIYAGLHGLAHGLETILQAAALLTDYPDILFLLVGEGPEKPRLEQLATEMGLPNVRFHRAVPEVELARLISLADLGIDTRRRLDISRGTLPVKMFAYMACARPVLLAISGEAAHLLQEAKAGMVVEPENPSALAQAVLALRDDPESRAAYGRSGRAFVAANYSRQQLAAQLERVLRLVVQEPPAGKKTAEVGDFTKEPS